MPRPYLAASAVLLLAACSTSPRQPVESVPVQTREVRTQTFHTTLELSGTLQPARSVTAGAGVAGRLIEVSVRVGDRVQPGQPIARVDTAAYNAAFSQAQGGVQSAAANRDVAAAQLRAARARLALAQVTADRMSSLYSTGDVSRQRRDETHADLASARAAVAQAQAALEASAGAVAQSQGALSSAQVPLTNATVYAPFAGIVTAKLADAGAVVSPGTPIATIETDRDLEVDLTVPEDAAASLVPGQSVPVRVDALAAGAVPGRIRAVVPSDAGTLHSATVKVRVSGSREMLAGMFVRVALPTATHTGPAVPAAALTNRAGQDGVFVVRAGRAIFMPVETGVSGDGSIEVRGLAALSRVAITNVPRLSDGTPVSASPK